MEKKQVYSEVCSAEELQGLVGTTITSVQSYGPVEDEGLCIDCEDKDKNLVSFLLSEENSWHFYNARKKSVTKSQLGELSVLAGCSDICSVDFSNADPFIEINIKARGLNAADRVLTMIRELFPMIKVTEAHSMYQCIESDYSLAIVVAVMEE